MRTFITILSVLLLSYAWPAQATSPSLQQCLDQHSSCIQSCLGLESDGSQAACVTKCAGAQASCAGQVGLGTSKPFLDQKIEQLDGLLNGLLNEFLKDLMPPPSQENSPSPQQTEQDT